MKLQLTLCTALALSSAMLVAQEPKPTVPDQPSGATNPRANSYDHHTDGTNGGPEDKTRDKVFLRKAAAGGMAEVEMGKLAVQKGSSDEVKKFGQKMVDDHTMLNNKMQPFLAKYNVKPPMKPGKEAQETMDKLNGLSGEDFDKAYIQAMVEDHHKDMRLFKMEIGSTGDNELRAGVQDGLTVITEHAQMIDAMAQSRGFSTPKMKH